MPAAKSCCTLVQLAACFGLVSLDWVPTTSSQRSGKYGPSVLCISSCRYYDIQRMRASSHLGLILNIHMASPPNIDTGQCDLRRGSLHSLCEMVCVYYGLPIDGPCYSKEKWVRWIWLGPLHRLARCCKRQNHGDIDNHNRPASLSLAGTKARERAYNKSSFRCCRQADSLLNLL